MKKGWLNTTDCYVETKYLSPTDYRGARIAARVVAGGEVQGRRFYPYAHELTAFDNHRECAVSVLAEVLEKPEDLPSCGLLFHCSGGLKYLWPFRWQ